MKNLLNFKFLICLFFTSIGALLMQSCTVYNPYNLAVVPVSDIIQMSKNGESSKQIINKLEDTHSVYLLQADEYVKLKNEGVQDSVINYMEMTKMEAIRMNQRARDTYYGYPGMYDWNWGYYYGWPYGWPYTPSIIFRGGGDYHGYGGYHRSYGGGGFHGGSHGRR
jgi:hypothetical protein